MNDFYPVVDLFAGCGGLEEGFHSLKNRNGYPLFKTVAAIEKDDTAHKTLLLRHFFREFRDGDAPEEYYDYISGNGPLGALKKKYPAQWDSAAKSAINHCLTWFYRAEIRNIIEGSLCGNRKWVLVGGPPCQAYSIVGRWRKKDRKFTRDEKHRLYRQYLRVVVDHAPPIFVMENVKGLLSAKLGKESTIQKIIKDLSRPTMALSGEENGLEYELFSLKEVGEFTADREPSSFLIRAEEYGVPQARHRVFIMGIRSDLNIRPQILKKHGSPTVKQIIGNFPRIRSGLSKHQDSAEAWKELIMDSVNTKWFRSVADQYPKVASAIGDIVKNPQRLPDQKESSSYAMPGGVGWFYDPRLKSLSLHSATSHMDSNIHRYLFAAAYAQVNSVSPKIADFPKELLPNHKNVRDGGGDKIFCDRFRVQLADRYATTIISHIHKDGNYFIHYDPTQCRSLTVREAARLQTFPDNYFFAGPRTEQYLQIGNAVPPYLSRQIAEIIADVLDQIP
jgi:DNA (cytosine-5)-methyltransferase 1